MSKYTLSIFRQIFQNLPPLFPEETVLKMKNALEQLENNNSATQKMAEDTLIRFGYDLWPYNEAYREFYLVNEGRLCEQFFLAHLSTGLGSRIIGDRPFAHVWQELYAGRKIQDYDAEERNELSRAMIETKRDLARFTDREIVGLNKQKYLDKVEDFKQILSRIKEIFSSLRKMADDSQYHPMLAEEIRQRVRWFEMGLCALAPNLNLDDVYRSIDFFAERKLHLNMMRGIDKPAEVNLYD